MQDGKYKNAPRFVLTGVVSGGRKDVSDLVLSVWCFSFQRRDGKILLVRKMETMNKSSGRSQLKGAVTDGFRSLAPSKPAWVRALETGRKLGIPVKFRLDICNFFNNPHAQQTAVCVTHAQKRVRLLRAR